MLYTLHIHNFLKTSFKNSTNILKMFFKTCNKKRSNSISQTKISLSVANISIFSVSELIRLINGSEFPGRNKHRMKVTVLVCNHNATWGWKTDFYIESFLYLPASWGSNLKNDVSVEHKFKIKSKKKRKCFHLFPYLKQERKKEFIRYF